MRFFALIAAFLCAASAAEAQVKLGAEIVSYGIYTTGTVTLADAPDLLSGKFGHLSGVTNVERTTTIPAQRGLSFGIQFRFTGPAPGATVLYTVTTQYPKPGMTNDAGKTAFRESTSDLGSVGEIAYYGFTFDHPWEMVCGHWQLEVWAGDQQLAVQEFQVVSPNCPTS